VGWTPGAYPPAVTIRMISEPADRLDAARAAGWTETPQPGEPQKA
jgi:hypothetical protein